MKQSTKRLFSSAFALVLVIVAFGMFFSLVKPAYEEVNTLRAQLEGQLAFAQNQKDVITKVQKLVSTYQGTDSQQIVSLALPTTPEVAEVIGQLNGLVVMNNLTPQAYTATLSDALPTATSTRRTAASSVKLKPLGVITIKFRAIGSYGDMKNFLGSVETNIRVMDVKQLSLAPIGLVGPKSNPDLFAYDFTVAAYYQKD